jgi:hypothetical protein
MTALTAAQDLAAGEHLRDITFTPIFTATVNTQTGEVTGSFDWADSCQGENPGDRDLVASALAEVVCEMLDACPALEQFDAVKLGAVPHRFVVMRNDGAWGAMLFDTEQACVDRVTGLTARCGEGFYVEEVRVGPAAHRRGGALTRAAAWRRARRARKAAA